MSVWDMLFDTSHQNVLVWLVMTCLFMFFTDHISKFKIFRFIFSKLKGVF